MKINPPDEEKKLVRRLRLLRLGRRMAQWWRGRPVSSLIHRTCDFGGRPENNLEMVAPFYEHLLIHLDHHNWIERNIICTGAFEPWVADFLARSLKPGQIAFDVGANIGCHTLVMAGAVGAGGRVLSFEPNPRMLARLQANMRLNHFENVETFSTALSRERGQQSLFIPVETEPNQGLGSLHRRNVPDACQEISVAVCSLDEVVDARALPRVDLIKVDVEGNELQVLLGARRTLEKFKPTLIFEFSEKQWRNGGFSPEEVERLLTDLGYELFVMREELTTSIKQGVSEECDLLALPR